MPVPPRDTGAGVIWKLAWPVMLSQILVTSVGLIDIAMVGRLGHLQVAAVGYAAQFFFMAQSVLMAVGFACVALMAQAIGAGDAARSRAAMLASLVAAEVTAAALAILVLWAPETYLAWLDAAPEVAAMTVPYMRWVFASSLLLAISLTFENALRADRDTATPMRVAAIVTVVKVVLNALLIFGLFGAPRLELVGAGVSTFCSQVVAVALFVLVLKRSHVTSATSPSAADLPAARRMLPAVLKIAAPGVAERVVLNLALLVYFAVLGAYGTVAVAAYAVGVRVLAFSWIPGIGFGAAAATLVGQAVGAGDIDAAERIGWRATRIALATAIVLGAFCAIAREPLARVFVTDPDTVRTLGPFMLMLALAQPFLQTHFTLGGAHRGAGDTWTPLFAAAVGNWVLRVPLAYLFTRGLGLGLTWVWAALVLDHFARAVWLAIAFRRGGWRRRLAT